MTKARANLLDPGYCVNCNQPLDIDPNIKVIYHSQTMSYECPEPEVKK